MRVVLVTNDYPPKAGGIQQYLGNIVAHYEGPIRVLGPSDPRAEPDERVVRSRSSFMWPTPLVRRWVVRNVTEFEADVVVYGAPYPLAQMGPAVAEATGVPFVVMTHGAEAVMPLAMPVTRRAVAEPIRRAGTVFAVSEFTAGRVARAVRRPVATLGAGVDVDAFHPADAPPARFTIGCVSRFVPRKGQVTVLRAAAELRACGYDVEVLLVGRGRLEAQLRTLAAELDVPTRLEVDVAWDRLPGLYREMSMFAMPARSRWMGLEIEGLGIVYLEAAASGLPVVAGTSGGAPETVEPSVTGWVGDSVGDIVAAAERLLDDPELAVEMGEAGRRRVEERFTWDAVMDRFTAGLREASEAKSL